MPPGTVWPRSILSEPTPRGSVPSSGEVGVMRRLLLSAAAKSHAVSLLPSLIGSLNAGIDIHITPQHTRPGAYYVDPPCHRRCLSPHSRRVGCPLSPGAR